MHHITSQLYIFNKFLVIKNIEAIKKLNIMKALYIYNTYQSTCEIGSKTVLEYYLDDIVDCFFFVLFFSFWLFDYIYKKIYFMFCICRPHIFVQDVCGRYY